MNFEQPTQGKRRAVMRGAFLAGASLGVLALGAGCAPSTAPMPMDSYTICDDTANNATCPNDTSPVVVSNSF